MSFSRMPLLRNALLEMSLRYWILVLMWICNLIAGQVSIPKEEYETLEQFFKMCVSEEEYGYVLEGVKPISIREFYSIEQFPVFKDIQYAKKEFKNTLLVEESIPIWNKLCANQKIFILKVIPVKSSDVLSRWEIQFIHVPKLKNVIEKSIDLFRYVLGPCTNTEELVHRITHSEESLSSILRYDRTLEGIVLGFGSHNSVVGGRKETDRALMFSKDCAPFLPKSLLMLSQENQNLPPEAYGYFFLEFAGGDDAFFKNDFSHLLTSGERETLAIDQMSEVLPSSLKEKPVFIFNAFQGGPSNKPFFNDLLQAQKKIQTLLKKQDFLGAILKKMGLEKPKLIPSHSKRTKHLNEQSWISTLQKAADQFKDQYRLAFIESFCNPTDSSRECPKMAGASEAVLKGLNRALNNLETTNLYFEELSKDPSLQMIAPKQLYCKTILAGQGIELKGMGRARFGYMIQDLEKNILFANHDIWLDLSQTISSFAHGIQGMKMGEKRILYIHPSLGYGALTTLPPCAGLIIECNLLELEETSTASLPPLIPLDMSWVQKPDFLQVIKDSIDQQPRFLGTFYRDMLDKMDWLNKTEITAELKIDSKRVL